MRIIEQSWKFENRPTYQAAVRQIEAAARTCYKSEKDSSFAEAEAFVLRLIRSGHHSVLEHVPISCRIVTNRGVSHEIVRHRLASYSQESTRYCNYSADVIFIRPVWCSPSICGAYDSTDLWTVSDDPDEVFCLFLQSCEIHYNSLLVLGWLPQQAREVLPNALKTELVMTANVREWRHFFKLRADKAAHPQMRDLASDMLSVFTNEFPCLFRDIYAEVHNVQSGD